jgi:hypothetical protein
MPWRRRGGDQRKHKAFGRMMSAWVGAGKPVNDTPPCTTTTPTPTPSLAHISTTYVPHAHTHTNTPATATTTTNTNHNHNHTHSNNNNSSSSSNSNSRQQTATTIKKNSWGGAHRDSAPPGPLGSNANGARLNDTVVASKSSEDSTPRMTATRAVPVCIVHTAAHASDKQNHHDCTHSNAHEEHLSMGTQTPSTPTNKHMHTHTKYTHTHTKHTYTYKIHIRIHIHIHIHIHT